MCHLIIENHGSSDALGKNASGVISLLKEDMLFCDVTLIADSHKYYLNMYFSWHQKGDPYIGGTLGYLSNHILVNHYSIDQGLKAALNGKLVCDEGLKRYKVDGRTSKSLLHLVAL